LITLASTDQTVPNHSDDRLLWGWPFPALFAPPREIPSGVFCQESLLADCATRSAMVSYTTQVLQQSTYWPTVNVEAGLLNIDLVTIWPILKVYLPVIHKAG
jgi:hypothetical protein